MREIATSCGGALALAGAGLGAVDVVDHGEVGRFGAVGDLDPHGRAGGIVGETDVTVRLPGEGGDLDRRACDLDAGPGPGNNSPRANRAAIASGTTEARIFKRNMTRYPLTTSPRQRGLWLAEGKEN